MSRTLSQIRPPISTLMSAALAASILASSAGASTNDNRPRISLFPSALVENLKVTSQSAAELETEMLDVVERMERLSTAYEETQCALDDDLGCKTIRTEIRRSYVEMLEIMRGRLPQMRDSLLTTSSMMAERLYQEIGQKMTPGDVQRELAGRSSGFGSLRPPPPRDQQGKLSRMFSRYYELVARGGSQAESLPVLASQIHLDAQTSLQFLDRIDLEINSQNLELVLELEWGELDEGMLTTAYNVKTLLWGDPQSNERILDYGLEPPSARDAFSDLLIQ